MIEFVASCVVILFLSSWMFVRDLRTAKRYRNAVAQLHDAATTIEQVADRRATWKRLNEIPRMKQRFEYLQRRQREGRTP